jgi:hypothetical protein
MNGSVEVITKRHRELAREYFVKPGAVVSVGVCVCVCVCACARARAKNYYGFSKKY